jgi:hypothetical protein
MTSSLSSDQADADRITIPPPPDPEDAISEGPSWVLVRLWSADDFHRAGEVAVLPDLEDCWFGRGDDELDGCVYFAEQRPGQPRPERPPAPLLAGTAISRRQLELHATATGVEMKSVGRCKTLVNGVETDRAALKEGDTVRLGGQALFLCTRRPRTLGPRGWTPTLHPFGGPDAAGIVGESPAAWQLRSRMAASAATYNHALIHGETGTGKELVALFLHEGSARAKGPWVVWNAAHLGAPMSELTIFGHPADYPGMGLPDDPGLVGRADGGTLFLDHIADCPEQWQVGLHGVLDDGEYRRAGEGGTRRADLRIVAACADLERLTPPFRYRFIDKIRTPSVRERREDIPLLLRHLMLQWREKDYPGIARFFYTDERGATEPRLSVRLVDYLVRHPLRCNVWELDSLLLAAVDESSGDKVRLTPSMEREYAMGSAEA